MDTFTALLPRAMLRDVEKSADITKAQAVGELLFAALLWGFGFIGTRWALDGGLGPSHLTSLRFLIAFGFAMPYIYLSPSFRSYLTREQFRMAIVPGLLIAATLLTQTYGLQFTTVTKNSFITILYVVIVPLLEWGYLGRPLSLIQVLNLVAALIGAALMCQFQGGQWNRGDVLTLFCAFFAALHILQLEFLHSKIESAFVFNVLQTFWAGLALLIPAYFSYDRWILPKTILPYAGLFIISFGATLVAFMIQVRSQKVLRPSIVSMLFLLESPFAAFFAYIFFREDLTFVQWSGAFIILFAAVNQVRMGEPTPAVSDTQKGMGGLP